MLRKLILIICLILSIGIANAVLSSDIKAYYSLDGDANDKLGSNHGTVSGATTESTYCKIGTCYYFDGSNDVIKTGLDFDSELTSTNIVSVSVWVKQTDTSTRFPTFTGRINAEPYCLAIRLRNNILDSYGDGSLRATGAVTTDGNYHHYVQTFSNSRAVIYKDGSVINNASYSGDVGDKDFWISRPDTSGIKGYVDEVGVWDRALTQAEVTALYNSGNGLPYESAPTTPTGSSLSMTNKTGETLTATGVGSTGNNDIKDYGSSITYQYRFNCNSTGGTLLQAQSADNTYVIDTDDCPVGHTIFVSIWGVQGSTGTYISTSAEVETKVVQATIPDDTCSCPGLNQNWEIDHADTCTITDNCDLGTGKLSFTGTGTTTCDAVIDTNEMGDTGNGGILMVNDGCTINVS